VRLADPVLALDFDLAAAARLLQSERAALAEPDSASEEPASEPRRTREIFW